jgi:hypothetical protein
VSFIVQYLDIVGGMPKRERRCHATNELANLTDVQRATSE